MLCEWEFLEVYELCLDMIYQWWNVCIEGMVCQKGIEFYLLVVSLLESYICYVEMLLKQFKRSN